MRAWFNGRTSPCQGLGPGSIPGARTNENNPILWVIFICRGEKVLGALLSGNRRP